jgi:hypothetical protein
VLVFLLEAEARRVDEADRKAAIDGGGRALRPAGPGGRAGRLRRCLFRFRRAISASGRPSPEQVTIRAGGKRTGDCRTFHDAGHGSIPGPRGADRRLGCLQGHRRGRPSAAQARLEAARDGGLAGERRGQRQRGEGTRRPLAWQVTLRRRRIFRWSRGIRRILIPVHVAVCSATTGYRQRPVSSIRQGAQRLRLSPSRTGAELNRS